VTRGRRSVVALGLAALVSGCVLEIDRRTPPSQSRRRSRSSPPTSPSRRRSGRGLTGTFDVTLEALTQDVTVSEAKATINGKQTTGGVNGSY